MAENGIPTQIGMTVRTLLLTIMITCLTLQTMMTAMG